MTQQLRVFISSTSEDLRAFRNVVKDVVLDVGWVPVAMEHFGTTPRPTVDHCRKQVATCDVVVLLQAFRQGWVPSEAEGGDGVSSITALEIAAARRAGVDVLALLANENAWPLGLCDKGAALEAVQTFRARLNLPAVFFDHESTPQLAGFRARIREVLLDHKERLAHRHGAADPAGDPTVFLRARTFLETGCHLFVGSANYGDGPLSAEALSADLQPGRSAEPTSLAAAAEFCEISCGSRDAFLLRLSEVLRRQSDRVPIPPQYGLFAHFLSEATARPTARRPLVVVSTGWDLVLEEELRELKPAILTHVIRSDGGRRDGRIALLRHGQPAELCSADAVPLDGERCVIYKPLGSPLLHERFDADLDADTVVATETDHLELLARLSDPEMGIPASVIRALKRQSLLFVGYPMDVWHFRLVAHVFQAVGRGEARGSVVAVRAPRGPMEEMAWHRLPATLVRMAPDQFARRIQNPDASEAAVEAAP